MDVLLIVLLVYPFNIMCEKLVPKGTSYGYVPKNTRITKYVETEDWKAIQKVLNSTEIQETRSPKRYDNGYVYDPPPPLNYLPPLDEYPTLPPTDEEFINKPSHDDIPQDTPSEPSSTSGYDYPRPDKPFIDLQPPVSQDEPYPQYLPANEFPSVEIAKKSQGADLAKSLELEKVDGRQFSQEHPVHIEVTEMSCFDTGSNGKFQAILTIKSPNENIPVFEDATDPNCIVESEFNPPRMNSKLRFNIGKNQFSGCAVRDCSTSRDVVHLCVRLRFPIIAKMRLIEDPILTLQCRTQDRIAAHTKHLQLEVENSSSSRSNTIARGGNRRTLRSRVSLFRRGLRGDFSEPLPPKAKVPLGEMLMLKTEVDHNGGWSSSRLSSVGLASLRGSSALPLLGSDGCRTPRARLLCPRESRSISPLSHTLLMRAAMFDGMKSGDEVRLSVRVIACLDAGDCAPVRCGITPRHRNRRSAFFNNETEDSTSELSFEVFLPDENLQNAGMPTNKTPIILMMSLLTITIVCSTVIIMWKSKR